jgi:3-deoxy-D-manno-octulosonic-acid transferase
MRFLYTLLLSVLMPVIVLRLWWRGRHAAGYRQRMGERFARVPDAVPSGVIWFHAVSVGETIAAVPLIRAWQQQHPGDAVLVTSTTPTGSERVRALLGDSVSHCYLPYDLPCLMRRFVRRIAPRVLVVMETELWPNTMAACHQAGVPVLLANARLSAKSARGYARLPALTKPMLQQLTAVAVQNPVDGERFLALGLPADRLHITGSVKFDVSIDEALREQAAALRSCWSEHGRRRLWIAASTHEGEDAIVLAAHRQLLAQHPDARLVLVPRHPERFARVAEQAAAAGFAVARRSAGDPAAAAEVIIGDTMGELLLFYGAADVALVGGSLLPIGGHNLLEPAAWGVPVLSGAHTHNFTEIARLLADAGALRTVSADDLAEAVAHLLENAAERQRCARAGQAVLAANRGAVSRQLALLNECLAVG